MACDWSGLPDVNLKLNVRGMPLSVTLAIYERSAVLQRQGRWVFRFGLGRSLLPVPECVVDELRRSAHRKDYLPVRDLAGL
jgi:aspartate aminotransferase